jgi:hypothetical protein
MKRALRHAGGVVAVSLVLAVAAAMPAQAGSLTPGNVLVSTENFGGSVSNSVFEYTTSGTMVQQFMIPYPGGRPVTEDVRGIVTNTAGQVQIFNGTFSPFLTTLTATMGGGPGVGTYANVTTSGWTLINNTSFGGIGLIGHYVFVPDMMAAGNNLNGVIRFDVSNGTSMRFGGGTDYSSVTVGANGLVYAINQTGLPAQSIDVFDPNTLAKISTITLSSQAFSADLRDIAVDAKGNIFAAGWNGTIYELNSSGAVVNSLTPGGSISNLESIAIDPSGNLVVGDRFGDVILTTTSLLSDTSFNIGDIPTHVSFVTPLTFSSVPEPSSVVLAGIAGVISLGFWGCRRGAVRRR